MTLSTAGNWASRFVRALLITMVFTRDVVLLPTEPPVMYRKAFDQNLSLPCLVCNDNISQCDITVNDNDTSTAATLQNGQIVLQSHYWDSYGTICCRRGDQQSCYKVCPEHDEVCEGCLQLHVTADVVTYTVGDVIPFIASIIQRPHNGISLLINGSISGHPDFPCSVISENVTDPQVVYECIARKTGTITVQANVELCGTTLLSQMIIMTIKEQEPSINATVPTTSSTVSMTTLSMNSPIITTTTTTTTTQTTMVSVNITNGTPSSTTTPTVKPDDSTTQATGNNPTGLIIGLIVMGIVVIILLIIFLILFLILMNICFKKRGTNEDSNQRNDMSPDDSSMSETGYGSSETRSESSLPYPFTVTSEPASQTSQLPCYDVSPHTVRTT